MTERFTEQTAIAAYCRERLAAQLRHARDLTSDRDSLYLTEPRPGGKWSIAALFDHMAILNRLYLHEIQPALEMASHSTRRAWSPTLAGRILLWAVNTKLKLPTAPVFHPPDPSSDPNAITRFLVSHQEIADLLDRSVDVHWKSVRVSSPASSFVKLNLGDVFLTLTDHAQRHLAQVEAHQGT